MSVNVAGVLLVVWPDRGVPPFPELFVNLGDTARTSFAPLSLVGLEGAGGRFPGCHSTPRRWFSFTNTLVDLYCRRPAHLVGNVGVDVQRGAAGNVTDDGGERFHIHTMFQRYCRKCVSEVMKSDLFAPSPLQNGLQPLSDSSRISGRVLIAWRGEHPLGIHGFPVCLEDFCHRGGKDHAPIGGFCLGRGDHQLSFDPVDLPLHSELPGTEVEIIPLEGADFTPTQSRGEFQQEKLKAAILFGLDQQPLNFFRG